MFIIFFLAAVLIVATVVVIVGLKTGRLNAMPTYLKLTLLAFYLGYTGILGDYYFLHLPILYHEQLRTIILNYKPVSMLPNGLVIQNLVAKTSLSWHLDEFFTLFMFSVPALVFLLAILYAPFKKKESANVQA
ncbi:MAG: hypothetical protein ACYCSB_04095 [bacterium]